MVNMPFELVMFDLDGTLVETAAEMCDAVNDTLQHFGFSPVGLPQVRNWIGNGTRELMVQALSASSQRDPAEVRSSDNLDQIKAQFDVFYPQHCGTRSHLYPQVRETLSTLRTRGVKLAVVTNKDGRFTDIVLSAHQLLPMFDAVVSGDTFPARKPDPTGIRSVLAQFGVSPTRALMVGDSSVDVAAARNAGVPVWLLPYGYNLGQPIEASAPDRVIADFSALV